MKTKFFVVLSCCLFSWTYAQVGIGTTQPKTTLDVVGNPTDINSLDGITAPRMTGNQLAVKTYTVAQNGAIVYITAAAASPAGQAVDVTAEGLYVYSSAQNKWLSLKASPAAATSGWSLTGNPGTNAASNFLGTTDNQPLIFKSNNTRIGNFNQAGSVSLGYFSSSSGQRAFAFGQSSSASGEGSFAIGEGAQAKTGYTLVFGGYASAESDQAIAIGNSSNANSLESTAIGYFAFASSARAIAIGRSTQVSAQQAIGIGSYAIASGLNTISIGVKADSQGSNSVAIGTNTFSTSDNTIALGNEAKATGGGALALGLRANSNGPNGITIGKDTSTNNTNGLAVGNQAKALGDGASAFGVESNAKALSSIAIGNIAIANSNNTIAIGTQTEVSGNESIAVGYMAKTQNASAIAIGNTAQGNADNTIAIGVNSIAGGGNSVAIGKDVNITNANTIALGDETGNMKVGIGTNSPTKPLHLKGGIRIEDGTQGVNKVLTSDANGNASWQTPVNQVYGEIDRTSDFTISNGTANVTFNSTDAGLNRNVSIDSPTSTNYIAVNEGGVYEITYSYGIFIDDTSDGNINIYLRKGSGSATPTKINKSTSLNWGDNPNHNVEFHISKSVLIRLNANDRVYMTYTINDIGVNMYLIANTTSLSLKRIDY